MVVYGIKNCNTVKKALTWLEEKNISYQFNDYKKQGISDKEIEKWQDKALWESLINKRGTTWRKLTPEQQNAVVSPDAAKVLMKEHTSLIKRPIIDDGENILVGFDEDE